NVGAARRRGPGFDRSAARSVETQLESLDVGEQRRFERLGHRSAIEHGPGDSHEAPFLEAISDAPQIRTRRAPVVQLAAARQLEAGLGERARVEEPPYERAKLESAR